MSTPERRESDTKPRDKSTKPHTSPVEQQKGKGISMTAREARPDWDRELGGSRDHEANATLDPSPGSRADARDSPPLSPEAGVKSASVTCHLEPLPPPQGVHTAQVSGASDRAWGGGGYARTTAGPRTAHMGTCRAALMHGMEGGARRGGVGDVRYGVWVRGRVEHGGDGRFRRTGRTPPGTRAENVRGGRHGQQLEAHLPRSA